MRRTVVILIAVVSLYLGHSLAAPSIATASPSRPSEVATLEAPLLAWTYPSCGVDLGCWADVTWQLIAGVADSFWSYVTGIFNQVQNIGSTLWNAVGAPITNWLGDRWNSFKSSFIDPFWATMAAWFSDRFDEVKDIWDNMFSLVWPTITAWFYDRFAWVTDRVDAVSDAISYLWSVKLPEFIAQMQEWGYQRLLSLGEWLQDGWDQIGEFFGSLTDSLFFLWDQVQVWVGILVDAWWSIFDLVVEQFKIWLEALRDGLVFLLQQVLEFLFTPSSEKLNQLSSIWVDQLEHGAPGLVTAAAHVPGDSLAAVEAGVGAPCPPALVITAGSFSICGAIISATSAGYWGAVRVILACGLVLLVATAMVRRVGDVING